MRFGYWRRLSNLHGQLSNKNVIAYKEAFFEDATSSLCIVMEYADRGDLMQKIDAHIKKGTHFSESELWSLAGQIASGLKALHDIQVLHRDLKVRFA